MNNERYLFRGMKVGTNEWVYGYYVKNVGKPRIYCQPFEGASGNTYYLVSPETVCQFTGIGDKNGLRVFESDKIRSYDSKGNPIVHTVVFDNEEARFALMPENASIWDTPMRLTQRWVTEFEKEVIGSIHTIN